MKNTRKNNGFGGIGDTVVPYHTHNGVDSPMLPSADSQVFGGQVNGDGSAGNLPDGWSSSGSGGSYTLTHNLNTTDYAIVVGIYNSGVRFCDTAAVGANSVTVRTYNITASPVSSAFSFVLVKT